jgi:uncharacterized protein (TIGR03437 family)
VISAALSYEFVIQLTLMRPLLYFAALTAFSSLLPAQVDVLTANYDNNRTNANLGEFVLNKSNVNSKQFGKLYSLAVDAQVYAQPLYLRGVNVAGEAHNVLYVATMNNSVYAFDADTATSTAPIWQRNFGLGVNPNEFSVTGLPYTDILSEIGILGTPVIDPAGGTLYVVHYTYTFNGTENIYAYYLHALDLVTGAEKFNGPVLIQATVPGSGWAGLENPPNNQLPFNAGQHLQRPGLLLLNGTVYVAFGSHGDEAPWHGWLIGYDASTLQQTSVFNTSANNAAGDSIWQGGRGIAADSAGNIYCATGNGTTDDIASWGESVLRLTTSGGLNMADYFTPAEWNELNNNDTDTGSTGPVLIPGTNLLYAIGKEGELFLLDQANLGHQAAMNTGVVQSFQAADPTLTLAEQENSFLVFNTALWDNIEGQLVYMWPFGKSLRSYRMQNGVFQTKAYSTNVTATNGLPFPGMTVSSYGSLANTGILWITSVNSGTLPASGTLHAFDALDLSMELWNSDMESARDSLGSFTKFANPTVANGKVFAPTASKEIAVYGLLPDVPGIASVVNAASYASGVVAPGELVTIFGNSIGPALSTLASVSPASGAIPTALGNVQVTFGGTPAPLLYGSSGQINAVVPFEVAGQSSVQMSIIGPNGQGFSTTLPVAAANPSIFSANASGTGQGAILNNADLSKNSPSNPAARGSVVVLFATGTGVLKPTLADGVLTPTANPPLIAQPVTVTIGGQSATVLYQGAAPQLVAGVSQINVQVPAGVAPGSAVPVTITVGGVPSLNTVTMAVK